METIHRAATRYRLDANQDALKDYAGAMAQAESGVQQAAARADNAQTRQTYSRNLEALKKLGGVGAEFAGSIELAASGRLQTMLDSLRRRRLLLARVVVDEVRLGPCLFSIAPCLYP